MKLITKDGRPIIGTADTIPGCALLDTVTTDTNGRITAIEWHGTTEAWWNGQEITSAPDGQRWFIDENQDTHAEKDLFLVPDDWHYDPEDPHFAERYPSPFVDTTRYDHIVHLAKEWHEDDEIRIDPDAHISEGDDNGCYVQAWVWVPFDGIPGLDKQPGQD